MEETEYKITYPEKDQHKSFKIIDKNGDFIGSIYFSDSEAYISLRDYKVSPCNKQRPKEIQY